MHLKVSGAVRESRRLANLLEVGGLLSGVVKAVDVGEMAEKVDEEEERRRKGRLMVGRR